MNLSETLNLKRGEVCSIVGGGGKTSLLYALASESRGKSLFTTTTKMRSPGREDNPFREIFTGPLTDLKLFSADFPLYGAWKEILEKNLLKVSGYPPESLADWIEEFQPDLTVAEADGAAGKPMKLPAEHEPQIIPCSTRVIGVVGLDILNAPGNSRTIHRFSLAQERLGLAENSPVETKHLIRLINHPLGLFKDAADGMERTLILNKMDNLPGDSEKLVRTLKRECPGVDQIFLTDLRDYRNPIILKEDS